MVPRRPSSFIRTKPVATGGRTSGKQTSVSTRDLPGHSYRANNQAMPRPKGKMIAVLRAETQAVNQTICHSSAVIQDSSYFRRMNPAFSKTRPAASAPR